MIIPIIDIAPYLNGKDKQGVAKEIGDACTSVGFFMIKGHGVPLELIQSVHKKAMVFFDLPLKSKQAVQAPFGLGYMGPGTENVAATLEESSKLQDQKESLNLTLPVRDEIWPNEPVELNDLCKIYYDSIETLASQLMRLFALALNLDEYFFDEKVDRPYTTLRLMNYPPQPKSSKDTRIAAHTDYGTLTILWSPDSRGLQALPRDCPNEWIDVISPVDHFIINIGDLMMNWTNDKWASTLHRVVPHPETDGKRRMSIPFFHNPNPEVLIECIPGCWDDDEPPKYKPILAKTHLEMKVSKALGQDVKMGNEKK